MMADFISYMWQSFGGSESLYLDPMTAVGIVCFVIAFQFVSDLINALVSIGR